jgi:hypothetical protein
MAWLVHKFISAFCSVFWMHNKMFAVFSNMSKGFSKVHQKKFVIGTTMYYRQNFVFKWIEV